MRFPVFTEFIVSAPAMAIGATDMHGSPVTNEVTPIYKDCASLG